MSLLMEDRNEIAKGFRQRSDWAIESAESAFAQRHHHNAINRAWYSVMLLVTAATYLVLQNKKPPQNQLNWNHKLQGSLFEEIACRKTGVPKEFFSKYTSQIEILYEKREEADYRVDKESEITEESAKQCIESAKNLREKVFDLVGEWSC